MLVECRRRCIIDLLDEDPEFGHNVHVLCAAPAEFDLGVLVDEMVGHANWPASSSSSIGPPLVLCVTDRGSHVAAGRVNASGVARPTR